jgi:hypothetical protein
VKLNIKIGGIKMQLVLAYNLEKIEIDAERVDGSIVSFTLTNDQAKIFGVASLKEVALKDIERYLLSTHLDIIRITKMII